MLIFKYALNILQQLFQKPFHEFSCLHMLIVKLSREINELQCNSFVICGCLECSFSSSGSFGFCQTLIHVYLHKKIYLNS